jgi:Mg-chelatase subunit ChlD
MRGYSLSVEHPWFLLLLLLVPLLWWFGRRSLSGLGWARRWFALGMRSALVVLLTLALADAQLVRTTDRTAVIYLVDRSLSIPAGKTRTMLDYVNASIGAHRDPGREDLAGIIVFGREAAIEVAPTNLDVQLAEQFETRVDGDATNLAEALRLAQAAFPEHAARRVVILSDGRQTAGDAQEQARLLAEAGIGIDVLPLSRVQRREVTVEKITLPGDLRQGTPFEVRVVVSASGEPGVDPPVAGRLFVSRNVGEHVSLLADQAVTLPPGKQVFAFQERIDAPDFYSYQARFVPDDAADDAQTRNNLATAFTLVRGKGKVLFIEDWVKQGQFDHVVEQLRQSELEVTVQPTNQLFTSLAELQRYDAVVLADVPRASGEDAQRITMFSDEQVSMLVRNTGQLGAGLVMLGGPDSFGAGGWANTPLEQAMPVDFQVKNAKVVPVSALMLVIDRSGSMSGEKLAMSQAAAVAAVRVLSEKDYVGVVAFDSAAQTVVPIQQIKSRDKIEHLIRQVASGGGTNMRPGMDEGYKALRRVQASVKHMILLTDGQTEGTGYESTAAQMRRQGITTTTVAVGQDSSGPLLRRIAKNGTGKFYQVNQPRAIPRIFMKEAMRVARPLIFEDGQGMTPQIMTHHEALLGLPEGLPPITGLVLTTPKENPLVELPILSPKPVGLTAPVLATWQYGLGRSVAFTTDAGQRWASSWNDWEGQDKLFVQLVRWAMRPTEESARFNLFADVDDGQVKLVVTALDGQQGFADFLDISGVAVGPDSQSIDVRLSQTAPGRYVGQFAADRQGAYFVALNAGSGQPPLRVGVNVPYSDEFRDQHTNEPLLRELAAVAPKDGRPGEVIAEPLDEASLEAALRTNVFRPGLSRVPTWHDAWYVLLVLFAVLFLLDIFNRRVLVGLEWVRPLVERARQWLLRREMVPAPVESMARLRARKAEVDRELDVRLAATRFVAEPSRPAHGDARTAGDMARPAEARGTDPRGSLLVDERTSAAEAAAAPPSPAPLSPDAANDGASAEGYTARLLKAKKQVWHER